MALFASMLPSRFVRSPERRRTVRPIQPRSARSWLALCEFDTFNAFRDIYGRIATEEALCRVANVLAHACLGSGEAERLGSCQFRVVLDGLSPDRVAMVAERLCAAVESLRIPHQGSPRGQVTISIGLASVPPFEENALSEALERAEAALCRARAEGPSRVFAPALAVG